MHEDRVGVCSWSLRPASPADLAACLQRLGIKAVQLALVPVAEEPAVWGDAFEQLAKADIRIASGMLATVGEDYTTLQTIAATGGVRPDATWPATLERAQRVAALAAENGVRLVTLHAGFIPHERTAAERSKLIERLRIVADLFGEKGLEVALETGQERAETLLEALEDLDRSNVGVNFDPANMILYGMGDPVASLARLAPHVRQLHIKDARPTEVEGTWGTEVVAGTGAVDWPALFKVVKRIVPAVMLVIEREAGPTREADIAVARDLVARMLT